LSDALYAIGVDLGTTHCAVSSVDLRQPEGEEILVEVNHIPQLTAPGALEDRVLLPSFLYLPHPDEFSADDLMLPWGVAPQHVTGELARLRGAATPIRLVSSAKSWLCHPGVDRRAPILPVEAPEEVPRLSPLQASIRYLEHMRDAWNHSHPEAPFQKQEINLTVPASFDPAARELTAEAAKSIGIDRLVLLEEPQAALYSWIQTSGAAWRKQVKPGDAILVVDVGGGTTDLSLIAVSERDGAVELRRVAVGDHILLGGDNMDLALAHTVHAKLGAQGKQLDAWQLQAITHSCRAAKEALLSDPKAEAFPVVAPARGSRLLGKTLRTELTRDEVTRVLVEGFFPMVDVTERPAGRARGALTRLGLPYAQDPAVTRHLAAFLGRQANATEDVEGFGAAGQAGFLRPTAVLFNGGVFKAPILVERTLSAINRWLEDAGAPPARLLLGADLDLAVAKGAAYYGFVRRGRGIRIRGGTARSYYVGVESSMPAVPGIEPPIQALCLAPFGMEEGSEAELPPQEFGIVVGEPVRFRFFGSSVRRQDAVGALIESWAPDEIEELEEIQATLPADGRTPGEIVPVRLHARVTEIGTLTLEAVPRAGPERWAVEFNVRGSSEG
jgi:molecular chaperone DnaK (HSP70)